MKLYDLLSSLHTNTRLTVYRAERINGKHGYTLLKPLFVGRARDCSLDNRHIDHIFASGYNTIECYSFDVYEAF